jgi:transcriptional regulator with XRE-family HTH domain
MDSKAKTKQQMKKKFKQTRQVVKCALNDGWTQKSIADFCRTQQSIVSSWARGEKLANEEQLKPLLEIYGNKVRRRSFKTYYSYNEENGYIFSKVEGKIIFSYTFIKPKEISSDKKYKHTAIRRIVIHEQSAGKFRIIDQNRPTLKVSGEYLECQVEDGIWFSTITSPKSVIEVISTIDELSNDFKNDFKNHFEDESITLPFLIRKVMLESGFSIDGVVDYPSK